MTRDKLIYLRGEAGQKVVADNLGISQQYLSAIENGERNPSITLMKKFENYFHLPMSEIFPDIFMDSVTTRSYKEKCINVNLENKLG